MKNGIYIGDFTTDLTTDDVQVLANAHSLETQGYSLRMDHTAEALKALACK